MISRVTFDLINSFAYKTVDKSNSEWLTDKQIRKLLTTFVEGKFDDDNDEESINFLCSILSEIEQDENLNVIANHIRNTQTFLKQAVSF